MNNKNKILVGCLALLLALSMGYALFSENITINGSATAKGDFSITPSCLQDIPERIYNDYDGTHNPNEGGYTNASCVVSGNTINTQATLLYPSANKKYILEYTNTGTISAVFKMGTDAGNPLAYAASQPGAVDFKLELYNKDNDALIGEVNDFDYSVEYAQVTIDKIYIKTTSGTYLHTKNEILSNNSLYKDSENNYYLEIKPGESIVFAVSHAWSRLATETEYYSKMKFKLDIKLIQKTDDLIESDGSLQLCISYC